MRLLYPRLETFTFTGAPSNEGEPSGRCRQMTVRKGFSDGR